MNSNKKNGKKTTPKAKASSKSAKGFVYVMVYMQPKDKLNIEKAAAKEGLKTSLFMRLSSVKAAAATLEA